MCPNESNTPVVSVGIDIAKAEAVIAETDGRSIVHRCTVVNTASALDAYMADKAQAGFTGPLVVESTGYYHWPAVQAAQAHGLDVRLINPLLASKHRKGNIRMCKTDPADAGVLAFMGVTEPRLPGSCALSRATIRLRQLLNLQKKLEKLMQSQQAILNAHQQGADFADVEPSSLLAGLRTNLDDLHEKHRQLKGEIRQCAQQLADPGHISVWHQLPGVSADLAAVMAGILDSAVPSANSWVAFVGLDISVNQSGTHIGRARVTKRGHAFLRKRLFQAAWGAKMHSVPAKAYYDYLRASGRPYIESLLIIARKLLRAAYALIHHPERTFDEAQLFALPA